MTDDAYREWDAAYVLGALSPQDRREYEHHLAGCPTCRDAVAELAGMPGLLGLLPADEATAADPGPVAAVVDLPTVARAAERRRSRSRRLQVAAGVLLVAGGVGAGLAFAGDAAPPHVAEGRTVELAPVGDSAVDATLTLTERGWGTALTWHCTYPPHEEWAAPVVYTLVVVGDDGTRTVAATWSAGAGAAKGLSASTSVPESEIARVEIGVVGSDAALAGGQV